MVVAALAVVVAGAIKEQKTDQRRDCSILGGTARHAVRIITRCQSLGILATDLFREEQDEGD